MKPVCVLGNGQLGRMLRQAGEPLGIAVYPVGLDAEPEALPIHQSVITAEIERWPETALTRELANHSAFVNRDIFPRLADRLTQSSCLISWAWRQRPGSCWQRRRNGRSSLPPWANWRSLSAVQGVTMGGDSGVYGPVKQTACQLTVTASALLNRVLTSQVKFLWLAPAPTMAAPCFIR